AHAAARNEVDLQAGLPDRLEHPDVRKCPRAAAAQDDAQGTPTDAATHSPVVVLMTTAHVMPGEDRHRVQPPLGATQARPGGVVKEEQLDPCPRLFARRGAE